MDNIIMRNMLKYCNVKYIIEKLSCINSLFNIQMEYSLKNRNDSHTEEILISHTNLVFNYKLIDKCIRNKIYRIDDNTILYCAQSNRYELVKHLLDTIDFQQRCTIAKIAIKNKYTKLFECVMNQELAVHIYEDDIFKTIDTNIDLLLVLFNQGILPKTGMILYGIIRKYTCVNHSLRAINVTRDDRIIHTNNLDELFIAYLKILETQNLPIYTGDYELLKYAISIENIPLIKLILKLTNKPTHYNGKSPLSYAVQSGNIEIVNMCIVHKQLIDIHALKCAIDGNMQLCFKLLLDNLTHLQYANMFKRIGELLCECDNIDNIDKIDNVDNIDIIDNVDNIDKIDKRIMYSIFLNDPRAQSHLLYTSTLLLFGDMIWVHDYLINIKLKNMRVIDDIFVIAVSNNFVELVKRYADNVSWNNKILVNRIIVSMDDDTHNDIKELLKVHTQIDNDVDFICNTSMGMSDDDFAKCFVTSSLAPNMTNDVINNIESHPGDYYACLRHISV